MATKETSFFRDVHPFDALRDHMVPELLAAGPRRLSIWSAAAATGQEAYSVAMLMLDHFAAAPAPAILATDLSRQALEVAREGRYTGLEVNRGLPARLLVRHFDRDGTGETTYGIDDRYERVGLGRSLCYRLRTGNGEAS